MKGLTEMRTTYFAFSLLVLSLQCQNALAASAVKTVTPEEIRVPLNNPYMGWGLWAGPRYFDGKPFTIDYNTTGFGDDAPLFSWVLIDWMWVDLEPQEGQYYWKALDTIIDYWAKRGKQIDLRVWVTDDPGWDGTPGNEVCPEWLWQAGAHYREYLAQGKFKKREPDYGDPSYEKIYLPKLRKFLTALAERYDKPVSPIVMWGAMGYGQWGECHRMWSRYPWQDRDKKHNVLAKIVNLYADIFKVKQLRITYVQDSDSSELKSLGDHMYCQALDVAVDKGFALGRHGFIDGLTRWDWKMAEHGTLEEYLDIYTAFHSNYAHYYMDADSYRRAMAEDRAYFEKGLQSGGLGYRLFMTSASWPNEVGAGHLFLIKQNWVNRNCGRLYVRRPLKLYLTDREGNEKFSEVDRGFDQTDWIAGETYPVISVFHLRKDLAPGTYDVRIAMVDETGNSRIKLAIAGSDAQRRYRLGTLRISAN